MACSFMARRLVAAIFAASVIFGTPMLRAEDRPAVALEDIVIDPRNEFRQVVLTSETIERVIAAMGPMLKLTRENAESMLEISQSDLSMWDKGVRMIEAAKIFDKRESEIVKQGGFIDVQDYSIADWSLRLALFPEEVRVQGTMAAERLALFKSGTFLERTLTNLTAASLEWSVSIARQKPLPENVMLAARYKDSVLAAQSLVQDGR
jgi:hypothetical protein